MLGAVGGDVVRLEDLVLKPLTPGVAQKPRGQRREWSMFGYRSVEEFGPERF